MDKRDWELLDKQLRGTDFARRNDGGTVLAVVTMFFTGILLGGVFTHESEPIRIASNQTTAAMSCDDNGACRIRSHLPAAGSVVALFE
jgi:hypothetical protein